ncbi:MAG: hypothetical protein PHO14_01915 [Kiritimatiellae bacterium]|jgi:hypothetical protein|nr:hypothetical protein [Kiritimatiellia bacterium]MDD4340972.1 hypothetical protein [Kiritimatiellia bacterium]
MTPFEMAKLAEGDYKTWSDRYKALCPVCEEGVVKRVFEFFVLLTTGAKSSVSSDQARQQNK